MDDLIKAVLTVLGALGGAGLIVFALLKYTSDLFAKEIIEKVKSDLQKELEAHKTSLKKSEFIFEKEFEAASDFVALKQNIYPLYRFPDMEWFDACEEIAKNFSKHESSIRQYISKHGATIEQSTLDKISSAEAIAGQYKFGGAVPGTTMTPADSADKFWEIIEEIEIELRNRVMSQSVT